MWTSSVTVSTLEITILSVLALPIEQRTWKKNYFINNCILEKSVSSTIYFEVKHILICSVLKNKLLICNCTTWSFNRCILIGKASANSVVCIRAHAKSILAKSIILKYRCVSTICRVSAWNSGVCNWIVSKTVTNEKIHYKYGSTCQW